MLVVQFLGERAQAAAALSADLGAPVAVRSYSSAVCQSLVVPLALPVKR